MLQPADIKQLNEKGITEAQLNQQLRRHREGFPYLELKGAATPGDGIKVLDESEQRKAEERWKRYLDEGGEVMKMVPASGAASRMFKAMYEAAAGEAQELAEGTPGRAIIDNLERLPFLQELREAVEKMYGKPLDELVAERRHRDIITAIIDPAGMNYGNLPKGLLKFHSYPDGSRTPVDEHLTEGAQTATGADGVVAVHFTVSAAHHKLFEETLAKAVPAAKKRTGKEFRYSLSEQLPSTDTVAANPDGTPFRNADGSLLFRPGGHGALIENLNNLDSTVVFIKNIDNVVPDSRRADTVRYKTILAGFLVEVHDRIAYFIDKLTGEHTEAVVKDALDFMHNVLCITDEHMEHPEAADTAEWIVAKLDRPLRVCGMVRNEGEPGGGPFIARNPDGSYSPQILESHQIDTSVPRYADMLAGATHFNPVDLVCYTRRVDGGKYDLRRYVDPATGFISSKSSQGRELSALELPGLWNGAMSDWNTVFVEVPATTFNPVKTVNDLLRPAHQQ